MKLENLEDKLGDLIEIGDSSNLKLEDFYICYPCKEKCHKNHNVIKITDVDSHYCHCNSDFNKE